MTDKEWFEVCKCFRDTILANETTDFCCQNKEGQPRIDCHVCPLYDSPDISCYYDLTPRQWLYEFKQWLMDHRMPQITVSLSEQAMTVLRKRHDTDGVFADDVIDMIVHHASEQYECLRDANTVLHDASITESDRYKRGD